MRVCGVDRLDIQAGDVLCVRGNGRIAQIGANGGFMGHMMVVLSSAQLLSAREIEDCRMLRKSFRRGHKCDIWKVRTLESTRGKSGLHVADLFLRSDDKTCQLLLVGELSLECHEFSMLDPEAVDVWQSPPVLRKNIRFDLIEMVVADMKVHEADWSMATAAKALLTQASDLRRSRNGKEMQEMKEGWCMDPICTSVVVIFWQRYLFKLAQDATLQQDAGLLKVNAAKLILQWMPLKADGVLPGVLTKVMRDCGWIPKTISPKLLYL